MANGREKVSDVEILEIIDSHHAPVIGVKDLSENLPVTRQATYNRLEILAEDGLVKKYLVSRDTVWYITAAGNRFLEKE